MGNLSQISWLHVIGLFAATCSRGNLQRRDRRRGYQAGFGINHSNRSIGCRSVGLGMVLGLFDHNTGWIRDAFPENYLEIHNSIWPMPCGGISNRPGVRNFANVALAHCR